MPELPYGSWPSPITADLVAAGGVGLGGPAVRGDERWWAESRPSEAGRVVLVRSTVDNGGNRVVADALPEGFSARTRVHEYGGGAWFLGATDAYFSNMADQRLYRLPPDGEPVALTPEPPLPGAWRFADGVETPDGEWILCVRESHVAPPPLPPSGLFEDEPAPASSADADDEPTEPSLLAEAINEIVAIKVDGSEPPRVEATGSDFVSSPRVSPDGRWVSWIRWNHPNMPWDGTTLCAAPIFEGCRFGNVQVIAGNEHESIVGANWASDGRLVFSSDRSGYWNLNTWRPGDPSAVPLTRLGDAEIGGPPWNFGLQPWAELPDGRLTVVVTRRAVDALALVDADGTVTVVDERFPAIASLATTPDGRLACVVGPADTTPCIVELDPDAPDADPVVLCAPTRVVDDSAWISAAQRFDYEAADGSDRHAFFYPPAAPGITGPSGALPPLIVVGHGGPTAHSNPALNLKIQYWTSRGFAVVDVNYGGSTGFGRAYRRLLNGQWGVVDVADCVEAARHLAAAGRVDASKMAIRGSSAGGLTVLNALITSDVFAAGTSLYGVADLAALATDTHKFERRYLDNLVAPWPSGSAVYDARSPIHHVEGLSCPLLVLQGTEDEIVPPSQSEAIVAAVAAKGIPHAAIYFEGEQHGFRQRASIVRSLEAELWFYGRVFGFTPADDIEPIEGAVGL
ncbi:MAG: prolyl oligopeptidase family serine peptidase [Acidimicrobiales bacterium]